jgi:programmed cell death protein 5
MGGGEDPELEEIRRRKIAEIQQQQDYQEQAGRQAEMVEAQRQHILRGILTPDARERLGRLKIAYPDIASQVEDRRVAPSKREITIQRK